jgi:putative Mn2+ efflux pump MntP
MSFWPLLLISVGVAADAFAVSVGKGLAMSRLDWRAASRLALAFGLAQAAMPVVGWLLGSQLARYITSIDHWVAFLLLGAVGSHMLRSAWAEDEQEGGPGSGRGQVGTRELVVLSVATSIDALAVGISLALLRADIVAAAALIGVVTFALSLVGVVVGHRAGARFRRPAEAVGGVVLIGIGTRILLSHLAVI